MYLKIILKFRKFFHLTSAVFKNTMLEARMLKPHFNLLRIAPWLALPVCVNIIFLLSVHHADLFGVWTLKAPTLCLINAPGVSTTIMASYSRWNHYYSFTLARIWKRIIILSSCLIAFQRTDYIIQDKIMH